jgi:hypothetical protein
MAAGVGAAGVGGFSSFGVKSDKNVDFGDWELGYSFKPLGAFSGQNWTYTTGC